MDDGGDGRPDRCEHDGPEHSPGARSRREGDSASKPGLATGPNAPVDRSNSR